MAETSSKSAFPKIISACCCCDKSLIPSQQQSRSSILLSCFHAVCKECIKEKGLKRSGAGAYVHCPKCDYTSFKSDLGYNLFFSHQRVQGSGTATEGDDSSSAPGPSSVPSILCVACEENVPATSHCQQCDEMLCDPCVQAHKRVRLTKDHVISSKDDMPARQVPVYCNRHHQEKLRLFCESCEKVTCRKCQQESHEDHPYIFMSHAADSYKDDIRNMLANVENRKKLVEHAMTVADKSVSDIRETEEKAREQIKDYANSMIMVVNDLWKKLLSHLQQATSGKLETLEKRREFIQGYQSKLNLGDEMLKYALEHGSDAALLCSRRSFMRNLQTVLSEKVQVPNPNHRLEIQFVGMTGLMDQIPKQAWICVNGHPFSSAPPLQRVSGVASSAAPPPAGPGASPMSGPSGSHPQGVMRRIAPAPNRMAPSSATSASVPPLVGAMGPLRTGHGREGVGEGAGPPSGGSFGRMGPQFPGSSHHHHHPQQQSTYSAAVSAAAAVSASHHHHHHHGASAGPAPLHRATSVDAGHPGSSHLYSTSANDELRRKEQRTKRNFRFHEYAGPKTMKPRSSFERSMVYNNGYGTSTTSSGAVHPTSAQESPQPTATVPTKTDIMFPSAIALPNADEAILLTEDGSPPTAEVAPAEAAPPVQAGDQEDCPMKEDGPASVEEAEPEPEEPEKAQANNDDDDEKKTTEHVAPAASSDEKPAIKIASTAALSKLVSGKSVTATKGAQRSEDPNEDYCAVCHNGGDLVCCDTCPKVYHTLCHIPELTSQPSGEWSCTLCQETQEETSDLEDQSSLSKRQAPSGLTKTEMKMCETVLLELFCNPLSVAFHLPVPKNTPNYYKIIKDPMDFSTIKKKLQRQHFNHYDSVKAFISDVKLVFFNCLTYNLPETELVYNAKEVHAFFVTMIEKYFPIYLKEAGDLPPPDLSAVEQVVEREKQRAAKRMKIEDVSM